jgi:hypothetical protein
MTMNSSRVKRTPSKQGGPIRNPMAPSQGRAAEPGNAGEMFTAAGAAVCGVLENGVRTAYAVIDEYMRRGQEAARGVFNDPNRRGPMSDERGNFGGGFNSWNSPMAAMAEQWMTAMRTWSQMWSAYVPPAWQQPGMNPFAYAQGPAAPVAVTVKLSSDRPAEVAVSLQPGIDPSWLLCEPLKPAGSSGTPIEGISIARQGMSIQVGVKIGAKQAPGRYHGYVLRKADQGIAGELTVTVL